MQLGFLEWDRMQRKRLLAILCSVVMVLSILTPAVVAADGELEVEVTQEDGADTATVTVTEGGDPVEGANVSVETVPPGREYNGSGDYVTDENGTVELPAPEKDDIVVDVAASYNVSTDVTREVIKSTSEEDEDENETEDDNETVDDGNETVDDGNETDTNSSAVNVSDYDNFGQAVVAFVNLVREDDSSGPPGLEIAAWVTDNNPGNAPDHAGPPDDAGPPGDDEEDDDTDDDDTDNDDTDDDETDTNETETSETDDDRRGPPDDDERGPPDDAGPPDDDDDEDEDDEDDDDKGGGPPDDAGNGNGGGPP